MFSYTDDEVLAAQSSGLIPEGTYSGVISDVEVGKTMAGHHTLKIKITAGSLQIKDSMNLEHEKAADISKKKIISILSNGIDGAQKKFGTYMDLAQYMKKVPVQVTVKHRGMNDKGYMQYSMSYGKCENKVKKTTGVQF